MKKNRFSLKHSSNERFQTGGRKADSNYLRIRARGKKFARIVDLIPQLDQLMIVASINFPEFKSGLVDRFHILAQRDNVKSILVVTKTDLAHPDDITDIREMYKDLIDTYFVSNETKQGHEGLLEIFKNKRTALVGHSGVGKTTLLNHIDPAHAGRIGEISSFTQRGRHTTTSIRSYDFTFGGTVIDMPGMKEVDFFDLSKRDLGSYYPEILAVSSNCRFNDCLHTHEDGCAVQAAFEAGKIHPQRYENYLNILGSCYEH